MGLSAVTRAFSKAPAPASKPGQVHSAAPSRTSQFVLSSKVINAPQTAFLATPLNTKQQLRVAKQAQTQDPRTVQKKNKTSPRQVALPRGNDQTVFRGNAISFRSQNQNQLPASPPKMLPNGAFLASHGITKPIQAKTQAAAAKLHNLLA